MHDNKPDGLTAEERKVWDRSVDDRESRLIVGSEIRALLKTIAAQRSAAYRMGMPHEERVAMVCHEANRAYCASLGDQTQVPWSEAPDWQRHSAVSGVRHILEDPHATPSESHENWLKTKRADGWTYGAEKDPVKKTHPCFVPYYELPEAQRKKDGLFLAIVNALMF